MKRSARIGRWLRAAGAGASLLVVGAACSALTGLENFHEDPCFDPASCADGTSAEGGSPDGSPSDNGRDATVTDGAPLDARSDSVSAVEGGGMDASGCPSAGLACDGGCVASDIHNCGACGNDCTQLPGVLSTGIACNAGTCSYTCASGYTECAPGKGCALLSSDEKNCGTCGHDCQGGLCTSGVCQPVVIASGQSSPDGIAVDSQDVYWTNVGDGTIKKCTINGCNNNPTLLGSGQVLPFALSTDSTNVYWLNEGRTSDGGAVLACAVDGCGMSPTTIAPGQWDPVSLALFGQTIYWTNTDPDTTVSILSCPKSGCMGSPTRVAWGQDTVIGLAVNSTGVYWTTDFYVEACFLPECGNDVFDGGPNTRVLAQPANGEVAVDSTNVYWTVPDDTNGFVLSCPITGCAQGADGGTVANIIATGQVEPYNIVVDTTSVYWLNTGVTNVNDGSVNKCPLSGCPPSSDGGTRPTVLASGQSLPAAIALDDTSVYWVARNAGTVMKVAK